MVPEGESGGPRSCGGRKRTYSELRQVPWQSWREWSAVRAALFSGRRRRINSALDRIALWQSRGDVPVAVEISGEVISVHQRDAAISTGLSADVALPDEMLRMMYAMAIMRLVNGVVDQPQKRSSSSVATRAESAGLPRLLVDIRHESAHNELPAISLLRLGSKEALSWLEMHYWNFQEQKLLEAQTLLRLTVLEYFTLLDRIFSERRFHDPSTDGVEVSVARKQTKRARKALKQQENLQFSNLLELSASSGSDLVSIILGEGWLEHEVFPGQKDTCAESLQSKEESGPQDLSGSVASTGPLGDHAATVCKPLLKRLAAHLPELPLLLVTAIVGRLCERKFSEVRLLDRRTERDDKTEGSPQERQTLTFSAASRLIDWTAWLLDVAESGDNTDAVEVKSSKSWEDHGTGKSTRAGALTDEFLQELVLQCLRCMTSSKLVEKCVTLLARRMSNKCLSRQAEILAKLGAVDSVSTCRSPVIANAISANLQQAGFFNELGRDTSNHEPHKELSSDNEQLKNPVGEMEGWKRSVASPVSLLDVKDSQEVLLRNHLCRRGPKAGLQEAGTSVSRRWRLTSDWIPCPLGLLPRGRYLEVENLDVASDEVGLGEPTTDLSLPLCRGDCARTAPHRSTAESEDAALPSSNPSVVGTATNNPFLVKEVVMEIDAAQTKAITQVARPLDGLLMQNGSLQPCGYQQLEILQASIHIL